MPGRCHLSVNEFEPKVTLHDLTRDSLISTEATINVLCALMGGSTEHRYLAEIRHRYMSLLARKIP